MTTSIDRDYLRVWGPVEAYLRAVREGRPKRWLRLAGRALLEREVRSYSESFPETARAEDAPTREAVAALDALAGDVNALRAAVREEKAAIDDAEFERLYSRALELLDSNAASESLSRPE